MLSQVLLEAYQVRPGGVRRERGVLLSEKLQAGEDWQQAGQRAVREELGSALPGEAAEQEEQISFDRDSHRSVP